ncbi:MAG: hypothetical protein HY597_05345 [Candidatus Omnitrophica bacterium]|nr:hypothetical protein [Candidatus Omnitrophota bacterium]
MTATSRPPLVSSPLITHHWSLDWDVRWHVGRTPLENMTIDEELLQSCHDTSRPLLRGYAWRQPAISYGFAQRTDALHEAAGQASVALVRRPTGGGLVVHGGDLCYSLIVPRVVIGSMRELFALAGERVRAALRHLGVSAMSAVEELRHEACAAGALRSDVMVGGRKVAGCAGRRTRQALLVQGYIAVMAPPQEAMRVLPDRLRRQIEERGTTLSESSGRGFSPAEVFAALQRSEDVIHAM